MSEAEQRLRCGMLFRSTACRRDARVDWNDPLPTRFNLTRRRSELEILSFDLGILITGGRDAHGTDG